jgi:DNA-binding LytR/AlgR family response regulator
MVRFYDNGGTLRLTIDINALYYLESENNYINVHYKHNDKILSYLLRCKTSTVEKSLEGSSMVRCHRSYIINTGKIRFMGEEHRMHFVTLDDDSIKRIPVSKSYYQSLLASLNTVGATSKIGEQSDPVEGGAEA